MYEPFHLLSRLVMEEEVYERDKGRPTGGSNPSMGGREASSASLGCCSGITRREQRVRISKMRGWHQGNEIRWKGRRLETPVTCKCSARPSGVYIYLILCM